MVELSKERIKQILEEETKETEALPLLLRSIYARYMKLYEDYFADMESLTNEKIAEFRKYHEETKSLIKYYYIEIPQDICRGINEFEEKSSDRLLGPEWKTALYDAYDEFKNECDEWDMSENYYKAAFRKKMLKDFYETMESVFRSGFGSESRSAGDFFSGISGLLFGKKEKD